MGKPRASCFNCGKPWPHLGGNATCLSKVKQGHFMVVCPSKTHVKQITDEHSSSDDSQDDHYVYKLGLATNNTDNRKHAATVRKINTGIILFL